MLYESTRNKNISIKSGEAILKGISGDKGLFVPSEIPQIDESFLNGLAALPYSKRAEKVLSLFLTDFTEEDLRFCTQNAYTPEKFGTEAIAPLKKLGGGEYVLELFHGPTSAFKDMALQILPHFMSCAYKNTSADKKTVILTATSGDTGKAALEGFKDAENIQIIVFYPESGVSDMQKLQMATQEGGNVYVCAVKGNFDDTQTGVKNIFANDDIINGLYKKGMVFSSANSINWGRLVPQIVYYISAYCDLIKENQIKPGEKINLCVPTGNFGNILAAYYAKSMGLPVGKLICASNRNNILTDFINTGAYDIKRDFHATSSPSMDILISSNLERLLYDISGRDDSLVTELMHKLGTEKAYSIPANMLGRIRETFAAGFCSESETLSAVKDTFNKYGYLCDTHTAVAMHVYNRYKEESGDDTKTVIVSTASAYKFPGSVLEALMGEHNINGGFLQAEKLSELTKTKIPANITGLKGKKVRFSTVLKPEDMYKFVLDSI